MILNSIISCVLVIPILGFHKYWHKVFYVIDVDMSPTLIQLFQSKNQHQ